MLPGSSSPHRRVSCHCSSALLALCRVHSAWPCFLCPSCATRSSSLAEWALGALLRSREMVQFSYPGANRTEDGTILGFLALPSRSVGWEFLLVCFYFVLCFFPARAGVTPSP